MQRTLVTALVPLAASLIASAGALAGAPTPAGMHRVWPNAVFASSTLTGDGRHDHSVETAFDDDATTAWCEGKPDEGRGEQLEIDLGHDFAHAKKLHLEIEPGLQASARLLAQNSAPSKLGVSAIDAGGGATNASAALRRTMGAQGVDVTLAHGVQRVVLFIDQVAVGSKYKDTCITGVRLFVDDEVDAGAQATNRARLLTRVATYAAVAKGVAPPAWTVTTGVCRGDGAIDELNDVYRVDAGKKPALVLDGGEERTSPYLRIQDDRPDYVPNGSEVLSGRGEAFFSDGRRQVVGVDPDGVEHNGTLPAKSLVKVRTLPGGSCGER